MPKGSWREFDNPEQREIAQNTLVSQGKKERNVRVQTTKGGKGGKTVTVIFGLGVDNAEAKVFLKALKISCGTGGTIKEDTIELQGDQIDCAIRYLKIQGFCPKKSGG